MADGIGERMVAMREARGMSQTALARAVGVGQSAISQIEAGERNPSYRTLCSIARAFGVTVAAFVGWEVKRLTEAEEAFYKQYRDLTPDARRELRHFAEYLKHKKARRTLRRSTAKGGER